MNGNFITSLSGLRQISSLVNSFELKQNFPNPFNPATKIRFDVHLNKGGNGVVSLSVFDILGRKVATLVNEALQPGSYFIDWNAGNNSSGVYFYKLTANKFSETKQMLLVK